MPDNTADIPLLAQIGPGSSDDELGALIQTIRSEYRENSKIAADLAKILAASGKKLKPQSDFVADVASTGGPGSLSTLACPLYLIAAGAVVPKLGVPGRPAGGIDCLAQIPGYRTTLSTQEVLKILDSGGYAHFLATGEMAPLDGRMFRLRQSMDAKNVPTLVTASLLSKKIAVGVHYVGLDVRVAPHGNFGADWSEAAKNSHLFIEAARLLGIEAVPVLTSNRDLNQPYLGRRESLLAMYDYFEGRKNCWLEEHLSACLTIALVCSPDRYRAKAAGADRTTLRGYFLRNLSDQGADPEKFERISVSTREAHKLELCAEHDGFCYFPIHTIRDAIIDCQKKQVSNDNPFPDPVGLIFQKRPGVWVEQGTVLATARISNGIREETVRKLRALVCLPSPQPSALGLEAING
jgi:pyrimidine-nucleoside phosphorylase